VSRKKPIEIEMRDKILVESGGVFESKVVPSGSGAVINFFKRFIGEDVVVIIKRKIKGEKNE